MTCQKMVCVCQEMLLVNHISPLSTVQAKTFMAYQQERMTMHFSIEKIPNWESLWRQPWESKQGMKHTVVDRWLKQHSKHVT